MTTLPCPFCGNTELQIEEVDLRVFTVACNQCKSIGPDAATNGGARLAWNKRIRLPDMDSHFSQAQIRSLENECRALKLTKLDQFVQAALTGLLAGRKDYDITQVTDEAWRLGAVMLEARKP